MLSRRITSAAPDMDLLNDNECTTRLKKCCTKRVERNMENTHPLLRGGFDRIALENHSYIATRAERIRNSEHWILKLNQDGAQQPLNQRPDFAQAKRECKRLHDEYMARSQQEYRTIPRRQLTKKRTGVRRNLQEYDEAVDPRTGWRFYKLRETCRFGPIVLVQKLGTQRWDDKTNSWHSSRSDHS